MEQKTEEEYKIIMGETKELLNAAFDAVDLSFTEHMNDISNQDVLDKAMNISKKACEALQEYRHRLEMAQAIKRYKKE